MLPSERFSSLLMPFRSSPASPQLPEGYRLAQSPGTDLADGSERAAASLNRLLLLCGEAPRSPERWALVLARSAWHLAVLDGDGQLVGFLRATSDQALNANLWDLLSDPAEPQRELVIGALVRSALARLRRELSGCSISLSAPPETVAIVAQAGFVVDPGGIRAMGLRLRSSDGASDRASDGSGPAGP